MPAFRRHVASLFPSSRILIYDLAQAHAHLNGLPIPELPAGEHPDDLLNDEETATLLGVAASTVRAYATQGYLSAGTTVYSVRVWPRRDIRGATEQPARAGKGRRPPPGKGKGHHKAHAYEGDPRLHTAAAALSTAEGASRHHLAAALAHQHGGSVGTPPSEVGNCVTADTAQTLPLFLCHGHGADHGMG